MATWGHQLQKDDTFCETIETFRAQLCLGIPVEQILICISEKLGGEYDDHIVQLAIAECLWRINSLNEERLFRIKSILGTGEDLEYWRKLGADASFIKKRSAELEKFFNRISRPPTPKQMWHLSQIEQKLEKGSCFWYKHTGHIYGAVVLEVQSDLSSYYLIALSEIFDNIPETTDQIATAQVYTIAWFGEHSLLNNRRMHILGRISIETDFTNHYGIQMKNDGSMTLTNCGQARTWAHTYRVLAYPNRVIKDIIR